MKKNSAHQTQKKVVLSRSCDYVALRHWRVVGWRLTFFCMKERLSGQNNQR